MSKFNFQNAKTDYVGKRKIWFMIPAFILAVTLVFGVIYGFTLGSPVSLSMDFSGGYSLTVTMGPKLNEQSRSGYEQQISEVFETLGDGAESYGLKVESFALQGENESIGLYVKYKAIDGVGDDAMRTINEELKDALLASLFANDIFAGKVTQGDSVSATVSSELLIMATCAILLALVLMLIYIAIRFELLSGIAAIICLMHDVIIMFAFMLIFQIPISATFIAAVITILGYSINNTIIIFDRVRDIMKGAHAMNMSTNAVANNAISTTMVRSINTTLTTLITVVMVALFSLFFGVFDMIYFCLPLIFGLLAGMFSSILIAPSIWSMWKKRQAKKENLTKVGTKTSKPEELTASESTPAEPTTI